MAVEYTNWAASEPSGSSSNGQEDYVEMWGVAGGKWNDSTAADIQPAVVEITSATPPIDCDGFDSASVNAALWIVSLPFAESAVAQSNGRLVCVSRGGITSKSDLFKALEVTGSFRFAGSSDQFKIVLRTDGVEDPTSHERYGVLLNFSQIDNQITLDEQRQTGLTQLGQANYAFALNAPVDFRLEDNGVNIAVYLNGASTPAITGASTYTRGSKISIYNRENAGAQSELDYICAIPLVPRLEIYPGPELRWIAKTNQTYQLQSSADLLGWANLGGTISPPAGTTQPGVRRHARYQKILPAQNLVTGVLPSPGSQRSTRRSGVG